MSSTAVTALLSALSAHKADVVQRSAAEEFAADPQRFAKMSVVFDDLLFDYSKQRVNATTLAMLKSLAQTAGVEAKRDAMMRGEKINVTEDRAVLHTALRDLSGSPVLVDGVDVAPGDRGDARKHARLRRRRARGPGARRPWPADDGRRQYRHRRLGPRARFRLARARPVRPAGPARPFRLQRRRRRHRRHAARPRSLAHDVHHLLEDVHHPGDHDQRRQRPRLDRAEAGREGGVRPFRRGLDETRQGRRIRHRGQPRVRLLGLGRRPLFRSGRALACRSRS